MYSWSQKYRAVKEELPQILLVLLYMAVVKSKVVCLKDLPYFSGIASAADVVPVDIAPSASVAASSTDQVVNSVKESNAAVDALRRATPDNLRLTCTIIANRTSSKLASIVEGSARPLEESTRLIMTTTGTRIGCKNFFIAQAKRQSDEALQQTCNMLGDEKLLADLGLLEFGQILGGSSPKEDALVSEVLLAYIIKTVANEMLHSSFYCMRPPFKFFQYLSESDSDKKDVMLWCKVTWITMDQDC